MASFLVNGEYFNKLHIYLLFRGINISNNKSVISMCLGVRKMLSTKTSDLQPTPYCPTYDCKLLGYTLSISHMFDLKRDFKQKLYVCLQGTRSINRNATLQQTNKTVLLHSFILVCPYLDFNLDI